ncbi:MAG: hypothetical protein RSE57_06915 [Clostridia bacterium]
MDLAMNGMLFFNLFNIFLDLIVKFFAVYTMYLAIKAFKIYINKNS